MCGIAGVYLRDPSFHINLDEMLDTLLLGIEDRGKHATGFVAIGESETLEWQKASCAAKDFIKNRRYIPEGARVVIGHTRWATQGEPSFMENNHPIKRGPFFIIHNGHVNNDSDLFNDAERSRYGQVDSEAIAARLSSYGDLKFLGNVIEEIDGDAAVAAVDERNGGALVLARGHSSPLWVYNSPRVVVFASTMKVVEDAYKKHIGRLSKEGAKYVKEGMMLFWKGENEYWTKDLTLPDRWKYKTYDYSGWESAGAYDYSGAKSTSNGTTKSTGNYVTTKDEDRALPLSTRGEWEDLNYGWIPCDNCGEYLPWADSFDLWDSERKTTDSLCEDCYDMVAEKGQEELISQWTEEDSLDEQFVLLAAQESAREAAEESGMTSGLFGEYEAANRSILRDEDLSEDSRTIVQMIRDRIQSRA